MKLAVYARVSTDDQTPANQIDALRKVGRRLIRNIVEVFLDQGISGAKGPATSPRPAVKGRELHIV
jgi:DNA invertase Pin-like site-specific DNA recombinase